MKHLRYALIVLSLFYSSWAFASTCFWVPIVVSGAVSGTGSVCRLTITAITGSGLLAGDTVIVAGLIGATECNGTTTISTVVDSTHIELTGTTFTSAYVSGGTVAGGHWTTTNTAMWASGTGGTVGTCAATGGVPKQAADTATFDGSSGGGTVTVDTTLNGATLTTLTASAYTGTLDFSVNNPSMTFSGNFTIGGAASAETVKLGSGTFTLTGTSGNVWVASATNLTLNAGTSNIVSEPTNPLNTRTIVLGTGLTYATITLGNNNGINNGNLQVGINGVSTIGTLVLAAPIQLSFLSSVTITNAFNAAGTSASNVVTMITTNGKPTVTLTNGGTMSWVAIANITFTGSPTATNSFNLGATSGITITGPSGGGGGHIIGG